MLKRRTIELVLPVVCLIAVLSGLCAVQPVEAASVSGSKFVSIVEIAWFRLDGAFWYTDVFFENDDSLTDMTDDSYRISYADLADTSNAFMEAHKVAYCVQSMAANPSGNSVYTLTDLGKSGFTDSEKNLIANILKNGYPANKDYWYGKGVTSYLKQAAATQVAIWAVINSWGKYDWGCNDGPDSYTTSDAALQEMYSALCECGSDTEKTTVANSVRVTAVSCGRNESDFVYNWSVKASGCNWGTELSFSQVPDAAVVTVNGSKVTLKNGTCFTGLNKTYNVKMTVPVNQNMGKEISLTAVSKVPDDAPAKLMYWVTTAIKSDGRKYQNMVGTVDGVIDSISDTASLTSPFLAGKLTVYKKDAEDSAPLAGAEFGVYADAACTKPAVIYKDKYCTDAITDGYKLISDKTGKAVSGYLLPDAYYVKEISAPVGYRMKEEIVSVEIAAGNNKEISVLNERKKARYRFLKESENGAPLEGCSFELRDSKGTTVESWKTDKTGRYETETLIPGEKYTLVETEAPLGYQTADSMTFTAQDSEEWIEVKCENRVISASVTVRKQSGGKPLKGIMFRLYGSGAAKAESIEYQGTVYYLIGEAVTDDSGTAVFSNLAASENNCYILAEASAAEGKNLLTEPIEIGVLPQKIEGVPSASYQGSVQIKGGSYYLYDWSATVENGSKFVLPMTGGDGYAWMMYAMVIAVILTVGLRKNREGKVSNYEKKNLE